MANAGNERLRLYAKHGHKSDNYEDLVKDEMFPPLLFSSLERYLPHNLLNVSRHIKHEYMGDILRQHIERKDVSFLFPEFPKFYAFGHIQISISRNDEFLGIFSPSLQVPPRRRVPVPWTQSEEEDTLKKWVAKIVTF
uniref:Uncharacterized PKHD-type hydroxylase At1g22950-like n=1 Tax=Tanacetum cinerariifolium TaxID=118510 RepID=A0A6L2MPN1_TANCI|nr:uncharacterized PKHD-type hydroxylase At1g22950-like [Tanacetum cinerariifolium]